MVRRGYTVKESKARLSKKQLQALNSIESDVARSLKKVLKKDRLSKLAPRAQQYMRNEFNSDIANDIRYIRKPNLWALHRPVHYRGPRRGRPVGSKSAPKQVVIVQQEMPVKKGRGRPKGSKSRTTKVSATGFVQKVPRPDGKGFYYYDESGKKSTKKYFDAANNFSKAPAFYVPE